MPDINLSPYTQEQASIDRRRKLAEALQAQSQQPLETQMAGGWAIPISPFQGLAKLAQAGAGAYGMSKADEAAKGLSERRNQALAEAMRGMPTGTPAQPEQRIAEDGEQLMMPPVAAQQPTMQDNSAWLGRLAQIDPQAVQMGGTMLGMQQKAQENDENRAARAAEGKATRDAARMALEIRSMDQTASREERAAAAQQLQAQRSADQAARQQDQFAQEERMRRFMVANRPPAQPQPLVQIMGANGQPQWVERKDAVGKTPAGAGSKAEATIAGKAEVDRDVINLKNALDALRAGGGIVDTSKGAVANVQSAIGASPLGQTLGNAVGSKNQSARAEMAMIRPSLLRSVMQSTGMSARQMDSNAELKLWLSTATDPTKDYQANIAALNNIAAKYGSGGFLENTGGATGSFDGATTPPNTAAPGKPRVVDW